MSDVDDLARRIHDLLRLNPVSSPSQRALHAKGAAASGHFEASGDLAELTTAAHLRHGTTPALVRFSHPGSDPHVADALPSGRGMAVKLTTDAGSHQLVTVSAPAFLVRDGQSFIDLLVARAPDPATGAADPAKIGTFLAEHPEALPAIEYSLGAPTPRSYGDLTYHGLHTFRLVDAAGVRRPYRYSFEPVDPGPELKPAEAQALGADYLTEELAQRLPDDMVEFDLVIHLATDDDPLDDPTAVWSPRAGITAGRLTLDTFVPDPDPVIFDPNNLVPGIEPSDDPILALRRAVYGLSYATRTRS